MKNKKIILREENKKNSSYVEENLQVEEITKYLDGEEQWLFNQV